MLNVYEILKRRFPAGLLEGFAAEVVDDAGTNFSASTFVDLRKIDYTNYEYLLSTTTSGGHDAWATDQERIRIYSDNKC